MKLAKYVMSATLVAMTAAAHADPVLVDEGFDRKDTSSLIASGWIINNQSTPNSPDLATTWAQGDASQFVAQTAGATQGDAAYLSANYNSGAAGGTLDNWLISPSFSTWDPVQITFYAKAAIADPYFDQIKFGLVDAAGNVASFVQANLVTLTGDWVQYTVNVGAGGDGTFARFAIDYTGFANDANYIGVDTLKVTAVPEPSTWAMFALGLGALAFYSRRRTVKQQA